MNDLVKNLRRGIDVVSMDKQSLLDWENRKISTEDCINKIKRHNRMKTNVGISDSEFENWAKSLGYRRVNV